MYFYKLIADRSEAPIYYDQEPRSNVDNAGRGDAVGQRPITIYLRSALALNLQR